MTLFTPSELADYLQYPVDQSAGVMAERVVAGWFADASGGTQIPAQLPPQLFSWAIELGAIAHENPGALWSETTGDKTSLWDRARRAEILGFIAVWAGGTAPNGVPHPQGSFPKARAYPDPAERWPC